MDIYVCKQCECDKEKTSGFHNCEIKLSSGCVPSLCVVDPRYNKVKWELLKPPTNKDMLQFPSIEEVQKSYAYNPDGATKHITGDEYAAIDFCYSYLTRKQQHV